MLTAAIVVPSEIKDLTQNNRDNKLEYNEVNFNQLVYEVLRLKRQRTEDLLEINQHKQKIISLYSRINSDCEHSPLMKAG